jgi:hypothetical protein
LALSPDSHELRSTDFVYTAGMDLQTGHLQRLVLIFFHSRLRQSIDVKFLRA